MGYNVIDLINKAINISIRKQHIYENIKQQKGDIPYMEIVLTVLIKQIDKTIKYYEILKNEVANKDFEEIDLGVYDKISFLINEFNQKISEPQINNVRNFLEFSLNLEKDTYALFIDVQGRFVKNASDINTNTYIILTNIINKKADFITTLEENIKWR
ncbi:hypothetical protein [Clostridium vincentii]|uniref:Uncharacterized protein n=1 Tax=Clostridium vincentii TaxID=52704 RepID=A0A2T0BEL7_9CLOT|nr:hypothetical protein [Clostridium vincentii]PRR82273.1 hypothetical protein CLVI_19330 [Clostridium vincentii]